MAVDISTMVITQAMLAMMWAALNVKTYKNPLFLTVFTSTELLEDVFLLASLSFCPGLLEALQGFGPPSVAWFYSLSMNDVPYKSKEIWGIYILIFEKPGCPTLIYIGSATSFDRGLRGRWSVYDGQTHHTTLPRFVLQALLNGYEIKHKGLLVWCPIPKPADVPIMRCLMIVIETVLSFWFWSMYSDTKEYGIGSCCPWAREDFEYGGLCGHNALIEGVRGEFNLSAEELDALAAAAKERGRELSKARKREAYHKAVAIDVYDVRAKERERQTRAREANPEHHNDRTKVWAQANPEKKRENQSNSIKRARLSKNWYCDPCTYPCRSQSELDKHLTTKSHKTNLKRTADGRQLQYRCYICGKSFDEYKRGLLQHFSQPSHKQRAAEPGAAAKAKAAEAKARANNPGAIEAAKAAIRECNGDFSKAISKFNQEIDPVPEHVPLVIDWKQAPKPVVPVSLASIPDFNFTKSSTSYPIALDRAYNSVATQPLQSDSHGPTQLSYTPWQPPVVPPSTEVPLPEPIGVTLAKFEITSNFDHDSVQGFSASSNEAPTVLPSKSKSATTKKQKKSKAPGGPKTSAVSSETKSMFIKKEYKPTTQTRLSFGSAKPKP
ncbi:hypothetical protein KCU67_g6180, partial [Aureobasidium melanogenum]